MTVESATFISDLNSFNPGSSDLKAEGDDHIRLLKSTVKATFPNVSGAVTPTHTVINNLAAGTFASVPITGVTTFKTTGGSAGFGQSTITQIGTYQTVYLNGTSSGGYIVLQAANTQVARIQADTSVVNVWADAVAAPLTFGTVGSERARFDILGGYILGGTTPATPTGSGTVVSSINATSIPVLDLLVNGTRTGSLLANTAEVRLNAVAAVPLTFYANNTERMRITSAGVIQDGAGLELGFRGLPSASVTSGAFAAADRGKCVFATGGVTVPNSTMTAGDVVVIQNTTGSAVTITATVTTLRQTGTTNTGNRTLAAYGRCSIVFESGTLAYISGDVS